MTSVMALDGVTSFYARKTSQIHVNVCDTVQLLREFLSTMAASWKKLKTSNVFSSFIVCMNRNRSALLCDLLSNNLLFDSKLYEDKSLALRARDLIFFTTDLQTVNYYSIIHC